MPSPHILSPPTLLDACTITVRVVDALHLIVLVWYAFRQVGQNRYSYSCVLYVLRKPGYWVLLLRQEKRICMCSAYVCVSQMAHSLVLCRLLPLVRRRRPGGHWLPTVCLPTSSRRICACLYQPPTERSKSGDGGVKRGDNQWFTVVDFLKDDLVFPWVELPIWAEMVTLSALSMPERTVNSLRLLRAVATTLMREPGGESKGKWKRKETEGNRQTSRIQREYGDFPAFPFWSLGL
jgi:hypothetical protein